VNKGKQDCAYDGERRECLGFAFAFARWLLTIVSFWFHDNDIYGHICDDILLASQFI
jgi:hypothetical protein